MGREVLPALRKVFGNAWFLVCLAAAGSCLALVAQVAFELPPFRAPSLLQRVAVGLPALLGGLAALYAMVTTAHHTLRRDQEELLRAQLGADQKRIAELEAQRLTQRTRIEELSVLREVATVINQESDFSIIAEKVLELVDGLLEPLEATLFLREDKKGEITPFAHYAEHRFYSGRKVPTKTIPDFDFAAFESHSMVCRVHGQELHAVVPLKVDDQLLGVLFLVFPTDARPAREQREEFNRTRRPVLLEACQHISLAVKAKHLHSKAVVDQLTRLYSRSHFDAQIQANVEYAARTQDTFSLVLADIDHFKQVNDTHGHSAGDVVLARVAGRIQQALRKYDTAYRYGGEELAILLPGTRMREAVVIAERLRKSVEAKKFRAPQGKLIGATISLGVSECQPGDSADDVFNRADKRLYRAKTQGRNRVIPPPADDAQAA